VQLHRREDFGRFAPTRHGTLEPDPNTGKISPAKKKPNPETEIPRGRAEEANPEKDLQRGRSKRLHPSLYER
jgi:hypothetical protein